MNTTHTPGPWIVSHDPDGSADDYCIGVPDGKVDQIAVCSKRDAPLIGAAPDMYEALKIARDYMTDAISHAQVAYKGHEETGGIPQLLAELSQVDAALAKASGQ